METTNKHAYLIIVHNEPEILRTLVKMIDDERNDIFIHIDKKSDLTLFYGISTKYSKLIYTERINVKWGDISQVQAELILMETAINTGKYSILHIISGVDLPIKTQDYIHNLCRLNEGISFVGFASNENTEKIINDRTNVYHFFTAHYRNSAFRIISSALANLQNLIGIKRVFNLSNDGSITVLKKGCNWCSLTDEAVKYILDRKQTIIKQFKYTICPDELFVQSVMWNSPLRSKIFEIQNSRENEYLMCMREIDWDRGSPYIWKDDDFDYLINSSKFFARKFSSNYIGIISKIEKTILNP